MLRKKMPLYAVAAAWAAGTTCVLLVMGHGEAPPKQAVHHPEATGTQCPYILKRLQVSDHVRAMLSVEPECESPRYAELKREVHERIEEAKHAGQADAVSVYVRDFNKEEWFSIDGDRRYDPGELMRLPVALTLMRMAESDPALRTRAFSLEGEPKLLGQQHAPKEALAPNGAYDLTLLIERSLERSDGVAGTILEQQMDHNLFRHLLRQLGLPDMKGDIDRYPLSPKEYAQFIKALYNSSFLSPRTSQYLMDRLLRSDFEDGMRAGIPEGIEMARQGGEAGGGGAYQLHDAGMIYAPSGPYLAIVMTEGSSSEVLPSVVAKVREAIYRGMTAEFQPGPSMRTAQRAS